jgi:ketosteroid isomerase-like protein
MTTLRRDAGVVDSYHGEHVVSAFGAWPVVCNARLCAQIGLAADPRTRDGRRAVGGR